MGNKGGMQGEGSGKERKARRGKWERKEESKEKEVGKKGGKTEERRKDGGK